MRRPMRENRGSYVTTPRAAELMTLLGAGFIQGNVAMTHDEYRAVHQLYGYVPEQPHPKPPPPEAPRREDFEDPWLYQDAMKAHERAVNAHQKWKDPREFFQAGADRNAMRHAECDGLRMVTWLAKHLEPGDDPLKHLIQLAMHAGWDVGPEDVEWAQDEAGA